MTIDLEERQRLMDLPERYDPCIECGNDGPHRVMPDGDGGSCLKCSNCGIDVEHAWEMDRRLKEEATWVARTVAAEKVAKLTAAKTQALDFTTIAHCFSMLDTELRGIARWDLVNDKQQRFLAWLTNNADKLKYLCGLEGKASPYYEELNTFLVEHGFEPKFQPFEDGVGIVSILDILVNWVEIATDRPIHRGDQTYPGFKIDADIHQTPWADQPLVQLKTKTGHSVWLIMAPEPEDGFDLALAAQEIAGSTKRPGGSYDGVVLPKLEIDMEPDLGWLTGAQATNSWGTEWHIADAFQMFKLRLNEKGARAKVATGFAAVAAASAPPPTLIFDQPFIGYFTHPGLDDLPIAAFYAGIDSWKEPSGSLEEL